MTDHYLTIMTAIPTDDGHVLGLACRCGWSALGLRAQDPLDTVMRVYCNHRHEDDNDD